MSRKRLSQEAKLVISTAQNILVGVRKEHGRFEGRPLDPDMKLSRRTKNLRILALREVAFQLGTSVPVTARSGKCSEAETCLARAIALLLGLGLYSENELWLLANDRTLYANRPPSRSRRKHERFEDLRY